MTARGAVMSRSRIPLTAAVALILVSPLSAQVRYPTVAKTNEPVTGLRIDGTILVYTSDERYRAGSFKFQNFRSEHWPEETDIGWDRYGDYWILGEFEPAFHSWQKRAEEPGAGQYCLFHGFYSVYVTYT